MLALSGPLPLSFVAPRRNVAAAGYRADIDGLRAVAVVVVLLFHLGVQGVPGGFVGVDVFFVISGFVIARRLLRDVDADRGSLIDFYGRRARRLLPALVVTLSATTVAAWWALLPAPLALYSQSLVAAALSLTNLFFWQGSGYFEPDAVTAPLLHLWSLGVEEQFYLLLPILLIALHRHAPAVLRPCALVVTIVSFVHGVTMVEADPSSAFYLLPSRLWELMLGVLLALFPVTPSRPFAQISAAVGVSSIAAAVLLFDGRMTYPGVAALLPCLGAAALLLAGACDQRTWLAPALASRPAVLIGKLSYPIYLVHWPIIVLTRSVQMQDPGPVPMVAILLATLVSAWAIWHWVERPFQRASLSSRSILLLASGALVAIILVAAMSLAAAGRISRFPTPDTHPVLPNDQWGEGSCFFRQGDDPARWRATACTVTHAPGRRVLLWGDSFAAHYVPGLRAIDGEIGATIVQYTAAACMPLLGATGEAAHCRALNRDLLRVLREGQFTDIVLAACWESRRSRGFAELPATIAALKREGVRVTVIGQSPQFAVEVETIAIKSDQYRARAAAWPTASSAALNRALLSLASGARFVDPTSIFCDATMCSYRQDGHYVFADKGHLTSFGSGRAARTIFKHALGPERVPRPASNTYRDQIR